MNEINEIILEEALDALLTRVRWYVSRQYKVPWRTARAFNMFCDVLGKPNEKCWARLTTEETT